MSGHTFAAAVEICRPVLAHEGRPAANKLIARLLWHVEGADGGFIGLHDEALAERVAFYRLDLDQVRDAMWAPGAWPVAAAQQEAA